MLIRRAAVSLVLALAAILWCAAASAAKYAPPPLNGHVVDSANVLTDGQRLRLDAKLEDARRRTGFAIVVFTLPQLPDGMTIEDVGYETGNTWKVGSKAGDDGVILINSIAERKLRIETGKGVGGQLTDIQSSHINREIIGPLAKQGQYYAAYDRGTDAILQALTEGGATSDAGRGQSARGPPQQLGTADYVKIGGIVFAVLLVIILAIVSPTFREILFWVLLFGRFGGGGRGGGGGGGGSGYGGGGGGFGGGGSSDDY